MSTKPASSSVVNFARSSSEKAGITAIAARVLQVDLLVRHVEVSAHHDGLRLRALVGFGAGQIGNVDVPVTCPGAFDAHARRKDALLETLAKHAERVVPLHAMIEAGELGLGIGSVHVDEPELLELEREDAPLVIERLDAEAVENADRLLFAEYRRARIALALGVAPVFAIPRQVHLDLAGLQLRFLKGEHIRVEFGEGVGEPFLHNGAQAVDIPRHQSHARHPFIREEGDRGPLFMKCLHGRNRVPRCSALLIVLLLLHLLTLEALVTALTQRTELLGVDAHTDEEEHQATIIVPMERNIS